MGRLILAIVIGACCLLTVTGRAAAQADVNPTADPKLVPERVLAIDTGGHTGGVYKLIPNAYGDQLISVSLDKTIRVWDLKTGESLRVLRPPIDRGVLGHLNAAALHPDGDLLAVAGYRALTPVFDHRIRLISLASGETVRLLKGHFYSVFDVAFSPDGKRLASCSLDSTARIWDVATGETLQVLKGHTNGVHGLGWSADGKHLATASMDGTGRIWNTETGASEAELTGHQGPAMTAAWSPDGRTVATGCNDKVVRLFEPSGKSRYAWPPRPNEVESIAFSPDSSQILYTFAGNQQGTFGAGVLSMADGREISRFTGHQNGVITCTFLRDGKTAVTGDALGTICLWDADTGRLVRRLQGAGRSVFSVGWSPDGKRIAWGNTNGYSTITELAALERTFSLGALDFASPPDGSYVRAQHSLGPLRMEKSSPRVATVSRNGVVASSFSIPDPYDRIHSRTLLSGDRAALGGHAQIYLFDTNTGQLQGQFIDNSEVIWALAPSPDFRYLLSGSADQIIRVWSPERQELLLSLFVAGEEWIVWTPQGYYAASLGGENLMGWHINHGLEPMASFYPAARFHNSLYRPDIIRRLIQTGNLQEAHAQADVAAARVTKPIIITAAMPPRVKVAVNFVAKQSTSDDSTSTVEVQATATPSGEDPIQSLQLLVDGRPNGPPQTVADEAGNAKAVAEQQQKWTVDLPPGKHRVAVRADTDKSYGLGESEVEIESPSKQAKGNLYVLAVGISAYQDPTLRLPLAASEAQTIADTFQKLGQPLFEKVEIKVLTDAQATRTALLQGLAWLQGEMTLSDVGVVFFAGQAALDGQRNAQLLAVNAKPSSASPAVSATELKQSLAAAHGKLVLLIDAHSPAKLRRRATITRTARWMPWSAACWPTIAA